MYNPLSKRLISGAAMVALVLLAGATVAAKDFATDSGEWNGLSRFSELTEELGMQVEEVDTLDWGEVDTEDLIIVIYPSRQLDSESFSSFMIDGGRVLLADDFGMSDRFLSRLSLERTEPVAGELPHQQFVDEQPGWPVFAPEGRHPLLEGVDEIVANYPAILHNVGGPVVRYDEVGGFVYDMMLGEGRAVVVADPGIFLNAMLQTADNLQFTSNILTYLCPAADGCRVWLLIEDFETVGTFGEDDGTYISGVDIRETIQSFNDRLNAVFKRLTQSDLLYLLAIFLVAGSAAYLATVFPWRRSRRLSDYIGRKDREISPPLTEFDWNVARYTDPKGKINHVLPMAILKEAFEELFWDAFDMWPSKSGQRPAISEMARRFDERFCRGQPGETREERREEVHRLLAELASVPSRHSVFLDSDQNFRARDLRRLHRRILRVLGWMGLQDLYERRTSEINARSLRRRR